MIVTFEFKSTGFVFSALIGAGIIVVNTKKLANISVKDIFLLL